MKKIVSKFLIVLITATTLISCSKKEDFTEEIQEVVTLENGLTYRKASLKNQEIQFQLFDDDGNEIVENVTFYVDGIALEGNAYQSATDGEFEIYAEFLLNGETVSTETENFYVITPIRKALVEDYTGTWCGYCPAVTASIDEILEQTPHVSVVAIHNGDDISLPIEPQIREGLGVPQGSPRARIDRMITWGVSAPANFPPEDVLSATGQETNLAISIESTVQSNILLVEVNVASEVNLEDTKLVVYITEDGLLRDQTNYYNDDPTSPYNGLGNPIVDFEQNHTLRASLTDVLGNAIPSTPALTDYKWEFTYEIPSDFVVENLHLVAMVVTADNLSLNSQNAKVGEEKSFE